MNALATEGARWVLLQTAPWGHRMRLPGYHLARWLTARGSRVAYVSVPVSPWHFLDPKARALARSRWNQEGPHGRWREEKLFTFIPRTWLPIHRRWPFDSEFAWRHSLRCTTPNATRSLRGEGFGEADVLVLQNPLLAGLAKSLAPKRTVYAMEDAIEHFPGMPRVAVRHEAALIRGADLVTATAHTLAERARSAGARRVHHLPNGVDVAHFARPAMLPPRPPEFPAEGPVAVYVGALDSWFDEELLAAVAERLPAWTFVLIGPPSRPFARLRACPKVRFLGARAAELVPPYLWHATAGIIPFKRTPLIETVSPLKLFEYCAAGLPTVATRWEEMERLGSPAVLCDGAEEFAVALASVDGREAAAEGLRRFAEGYEWERIFRQLLAEMESLESG